MKNLATRNQSIWIDNDSYLDLRSMAASGRLPSLATMD